MIPFGFEGVFLEFGVLARFLALGGLVGLGGFVPLCFKDEVVEVLVFAELEGDVMVFGGASLSAGCARVVACLGIRGDNFGGLGRGISGPDGGLVVELVVLLLLDEKSAGILLELLGVVVVGLVLEAHFKSGAEGVIIVVGVLGIGILGGFLSLEMRVIEKLVVILRRLGDRGVGVDLVLRSLFRDWVIGGGSVLE